jgi:hypothetical protein
MVKASPVRSASEPLTRLKPGGSGRDHRSLDAALALWATASALERIACATLVQATRVSLGSAGGRPKAAGRRLPHAGLVMNGLLVRRVPGGLPPRPGFPRLTQHPAGMSRDERTAPNRPRRDLGFALVPQGQTCQRVPAGFLLHPATRARVARAALGLR